MSDIDPILPVPQLWCKLCGIEIFVKENEYSLTQRGIIIAQCSTKHYTIHMILQADELSEFGHWFTDFIFINGFEVQRSVDSSSQTSAWFGVHRHLLQLDRAVTDEEFVAMFHSYSRLGPML